jgi:hypothetical protein
MIGSAVVGGLILGLIEGAGILMTRIQGQMMLSEQMAAIQQQQQQQ